MSILVEKIPPPLENFIKSPKKFQKALDKQYYAMYNIAHRRVFMDAQLKKGLLEVCVLAALQKEESYGYKIISALAPYIEISESTLYPILRRLKSGGMVTTRSEIHNGRVRKYFRITTLGKGKIMEFIEDMEQFNKISEFITHGGAI